MPHALLTLLALLMASACGGKPTATSPDARREQHRPDAAPAADAADAPNDEDEARGLAEKPVLQVVLPAAAVPGEPAARMSLELYANAMIKPDNSGMQLVVGGRAEKFIKVGEVFKFPIPARKDGHFRFEVDGSPVFAAVWPGDRLFISTDHEGTWYLGVGNRQLENAPKAITLCPKAGAGCPEFYIPGRTFDGDPVCPFRNDRAERCVKAPTVRLRGPVRTSATVGPAMGDERDDERNIALAPADGLSEGAFGPWRPVLMGEGIRTVVKIGDASAILVPGPGEQWEVWLTPDGTIDAAMVAPAKTR